jgi:hypothetical protein
MAAPSRRSHFLHVDVGATIVATMPSAIRLFPSGQARQRHIVAISE